MQHYEPLILVSVTSMGKINGKAIAIPSMASLEEIPLSIVQQNLTLKGLFIARHSDSTKQELDNGIQEILALLAQDLEACFVFQAQDLGSLVFLHPLQLLNSFPDLTQQISKARPSIIPLGSFIIPVLLL